MTGKHCITMALALLLLTLGATNLPARIYFAGDDSSPYTPEAGLFAPGDQVTYIPLSGKWSVVSTGSELGELTVPGCWEMGQGNLILKRSFKVPEKLESKHFRLVFWGAQQQVSVRLNGRLIEALDGDWKTIIIDLPRDVLKFDGSNELAVEIGDKLSPKASIPLKPTLLNSRTYAGIFADVALVAVPTVSVETVKFNSSVDVSSNSAEYDFEFQLRYYGETPSDSSFKRQINAQVDWVSPNGKRHDSSEKITIDLGPVDAVNAKISGRISKPALWTPEDPSRYTFKLKLTDQDLEWVIPFKLGFRSIEWKNRSFLLNGKNTWLKGIDYRQTSFKSRQAISVKEIQNDLLKIKDTGFNLVRVVGGPPLPATIEFCDQLGLLLIAGTGVRGVPGKILNSADFQGHLKNAVYNLVRLNLNATSIIAWEIASGLDSSPESIGTLQEFSELVKKDDSRLLLASFIGNGIPTLPEGVIGIYERPPYCRDNTIRFNNPENQSWLIGGLGKVANRSVIGEDVMTGAVRQSDALLHQIRLARSAKINGYLIHCYSDYYNAWPILYAGANDDNAIVARGLVSLGREERITLQKVSEAIGKVRIDEPSKRVDGTDYPIVFPIATIIISFIFLLVRNQNNVFRRNLARVFAHTHGFFVDIGQNRHFQIGQTLLISIVVSATQAVFISGWLYYARDKFSLDYVITLLVPSDYLKARLVDLSWHPLVSIAYFTVVVFLLFVSVTFFLRLFAIPFKGNTGFRQIFTFLAWGASHYLLLIPLGLIHYRFLSYGWFGKLSGGLLIIFFVWYLLRIVNAIRIGYHVSSRTAWLLMLALIIAFSGTLLGVYEGGYAVLKYVNYYLDTVVGWMNCA